MSKSKELSSPFSIGGGGVHFEAHVQASFVVLMLTGGHSPCLPCWPISEIKFQGKIDGFDTDDLIVFIKNPDNEEQRKFLGQIKHSIAITRKNPLFKNAWRLLHKWEIPPGTQKDGTFNERRFTKWLESVKAICTKSGHLGLVLFNVGKILIHTPPDPSGLWINRTVAAALNDREADEIRNGFRLGKYNLRGAHWVDPTGKPEKELAEQFRNQAEVVENACFQRFAVTLRDLADSYDREAERIVSEHKQQDQK